MSAAPSGASSDNRITIVEVSPRDGLQADPADLTTEQKLELVTRLVDAGVTRVEAASFVNPKAVPKMADSDAVMAGVPRRDGVTYSCLAFNQRGVDRAVEAQVDEITGVVVASETFSQKNQRASIAESIERWASIAEQAQVANIATSITVSAAWGCPYEGRVDPGLVVDIVERLMPTSPDEICLADTIGVAVPPLAGSLFEQVANVAGATPLRGHFHNTRSTALANIFAAIEAGVRTFDSSVGGVGGCPFAPKATGNVSTEDVVYMVHEMGYDTGLNLDALIATTTWLEEALGHATPGLVAKAGGFPVSQVA